MANWALLNQVVDCLRAAVLPIKQNDGKEKVILRKEMGLASSISLVIGVIIGSGIFVSPQGVLLNTGSVGLCLIVWIVAGIASLGSALCYAELGAMIPLSGGHYTYLRLGCGNIVAFLYISQNVLISNSLTLLIRLLTFSKYAVSILPTCGSPQVLEKMIAATLTVGLFLINTYSIRMSTRLTILTTVGKVSALVVIIIGGLVHLTKGVSKELTDDVFSDTILDTTSLALAFYNAIYAYSGAAYLNCIVEEVKNPSRTVPIAIISGVLITIVIYVLTNVSYLSVMTKSELLSSDAVASLFGDKVLSDFSMMVPIAVMISTFGASNNTILGNSRSVFTAARDGNLPDYLSYIHISKLTPFGSMTITVTLALLYLMPADLGQLIGFVMFIDALFEACVYLSLIRLRLWTMKDVLRPVKTPLIIPVLLFLMNVYLFIAPIIIQPRLEYVYVAVAMPTISMLLYIPFIYFGLRLPFYDKVVEWLQLIFEICPPSKQSE